MLAKGHKVDISKYISEQNKHSMIEGVFVRKNIEDTWKIYYLQVLFSEQENPLEDEYVSHNHIFCFRLKGTSALGKAFLIDATQQEDYRIDHEKFKEYKLGNELFTYTQEQKIFYQEAKKRHAQNPIIEDQFQIVQKIYPRDIDAGEYKNLHQMVKEVLKIDLKKMPVLENQFIVSVEQNHGKIESASLSGSGLHCEIDFDEKQKEQYKLIAFDKNETRHIKEPVEKVNDFREIKEAGYAIRLMKNRTLIDEYTDFPNKQTHNTIDAFIIHASGDVKKATIVAELLKKKGYISFVAHKDMKKVSDWHPELLTQLKDSATCIVIRTNQVIESPYSNFEMGYATAKDTELELLEMGTTKEAATYLTRPQFYNVYYTPKGTKEEIDKLLEKISQKTGKTPTQENIDKEIGELIEEISNTEEEKRETEYLLKTFKEAIERIKTSSQQIERNYNNLGKQRRHIQELDDQTMNTALTSEVKQQLIKKEIFNRYLKITEMIRTYNREAQEKRYTGLLGEIHREILDFEKLI